MKVHTFILNNTTGVVLENEHNEVVVSIGNTIMKFASYKAALNWVSKEVNNDRIHTTT